MSENESESEQRKHQKNCLLKSKFLKSILKLIERKKWLFRVMESNI